MFVHTTRRFWQTHAPLTFSALITALLTLFFIVGIFADPRLITGAPAWLKPAKFGVSITLYSLTLVWILGFVQGRRRWVSVLGWVVVVTFALEWVAIITQVARHHEPFQRRHPPRRSVLGAYGRSHHGPVGRQLRYRRTASLSTL